MDATETAVGRPAKIALRLVPIDSIVVDTRFRELSESKAEEVANQLRQTGRLLQPIGVSSDMHLVFGRHRLRGAEICGWKEIPASVANYSHDSPQAKIDELDENLVRSELTALETSRALAARKALWLQLHPETGRGKRGGRPEKEASVPHRYQKPEGTIVEVFQGLGDKPQWLVGTVSVNGSHHRIKSPKLRPERTRERAQYRLDRYAAEKHWEIIGGSVPAETDHSCAKLSDTVSLSFAQDAADKTGKSKRTIQRATALGEAIPAAIAVKVCEVKAVADSPKELRKLARLAKSDPELAGTVAAMLADGSAKTVTEALAYPPGPDDDPPPARKPRTKSPPADDKVNESGGAGSALRNAVLFALERWRSDFGAAATPYLAAAVLDGLSAEQFSNTSTGGNPG